MFLKKIFLTQKQHCPALENQFVELVMAAMERAENENTADGNSHWLWLHLSSQIIYFVLSTYATFDTICLSLHDKVLLDL